LREDSSRGSARPKVALIVAYDGTEFSGSQRQPGRRTIQDELERTVGILAHGPVPVALAGRTDAGVHALGQVAAFADARPDLENHRLVSALNALLPGDVSVQSAMRVEAEFDPRRDAQWRAYQYRICNGPENPLQRRYTLQVTQRLDLAAMSGAASQFFGEHDLASFCGLGAGVPWSERKNIGRGTVRRIFKCAVAQAERGPVITIDVVGDAFLPNQVRAMVGALLDVGRGRRDQDWIARLLTEPDRRHGPKTAPPHGLTLMQVGYSDVDGTAAEDRAEAETIQGLVNDGSTNLFS
jgi:tRNA pseudouridine38-40 synthase